MGDYQMSVYRKKKMDRDTEWAIYVEGKGYVYVVCDTEQEAFEIARKHADAGGKFDRG